MNEKASISPRNEALATILGVRSTLPDATISEDDWGALVDIAWGARATFGDRREVQRQIRDVLLRTSRSDL